MSALLRLIVLRNSAARVEEASGKRVDEWSDEFEQRFGLYRVDFDTKHRTPKLSASFYRETIARNAVAYPAIVNPCACPCPAPQT
jgi:hypothetical protein